MGMPENTDSRLLMALAEELTMPFLQIARIAELQNDVTIQQQAEMGLRLVNGYILGLQSKEQLQLKLEPITLSSVLHDTATVLNPLAKQQGYELEIDIAGKFGPVMGDRRLLEQAFIILGYELMQAPSENPRATLTLATHRSKSGIVAGVFTNNPGLTADAFRRAKVLLGSARQTLPNSTVGSGAGVFVADALLQTLSSSFKVARHHKQTGLAATLIPSRQLKLV